MNRLVALVSATAVIAAGGLVILDAPATANIEIDDFVVLPQTGHSDVVQLPGTSVLAISGGDDSPVVMVDVVQRTVRVVPDTEGVRTLDLDQDGSHLHGVSQTPDEVVEIGVSSGEVTRRWPVPDACGLSDVVMRGGGLWVAQECGSWGIRRLDPDTGALTAAAAGAGRTLVGAPGSTRFYALQPSTSGVLHELDATPGGLVLIDSASAADVYGTLRISDDGGTLFIRNMSIWAPVGTRAWNTDGLTEQSPPWPNTLIPTWSDGVVAGVAQSRDGTAGLARHADRSMINSFLPAGDAASMGVDDVRLVGDVLAVTGRVDQQKRLYVVADPVIAEPALTLDVPWGATGIDTPTPVTGSFHVDGAPVQGQELQLSQISPTRRDLGTVVTDAQGEWSAEWRPEQVGPAVLEVRYDGDRDSVARELVGVAEDYYRLDATGPPEVNGGDPIAVTFRATHNGQPMAGLDLTVARYRQALGRWDLEQTTPHVTNAQGEVSVGVTAGAVDRYDFVGSTTFPDRTRWEENHSLAVRRTATVLTHHPPSSPAVPGDPVPLSLTLTTADGQPVAGQEVRFGVAYEFGAERRLTAVTDEQGRASVTDSSEQEGRYDVSYQFEGTVELDDARYAYDFFRRTRIPTALTVEGEPAGAVGVATTLRGTLSPAEGPVEVRLTDLDTMAVTTTSTDAAGNWSAEVTPTLPGPNRWRASFPGNIRLAPSQRDFEMTTPRAATSVEDLTITNARYGENYTLRGRLAGNYGRELVHIRWDAGVTRDVLSDLNGNFTLSSFTPGDPGAHVISIVFDGDTRSAPTEHLLQVQVAKGDQRLELVAPSTATPGKPLNVRGRLGYYATRSTTLTVTQPDGTVTKVPITLNDDSLFLFSVPVPETPGQQGQWQVQIPGDDKWETDTATFTAYITAPHQVTFTGGDGPYEFGDDASVLIQAPGTNNPPALVQVTDPTGATLWSWQGRIPAEGLPYETSLDTAQRIRVTLEADATHHRTVVDHYLRPQLRMPTRMSGDFDQAGKYAVYDRDGIPPYPRTLTTRETDLGCLRHVYQQLTSRGWEPARNSCATENTSQLFTRINWGMDDGVRYRVRAAYDGDSWYSRAKGVWHYFRYR
jgi:hypothetical protein